MKRFFGWAFDDRVVAILVTIGIGIGALMGAVMYAGAIWSGGIDGPIRASVVFSIWVLGGGIGGLMMVGAGMYGAISHLRAFPAMVMRRS